MTGSLPEQDEDAADGWDEVPGESLGAHQPVHAHGGGDADSQVLVVGCHLLREHHLKVACSMPQPQSKSAYAEGKFEKTPVC